MSWTNDQPTPDELPLRDLGTRTIRENLSDSELHDLIRRSHFDDHFSGPIVNDAGLYWLAGLIETEFAIYSNGIFTIARGRTRSGWEIQGVAARTVTEKPNVPADIKTALARAAFAAMRHVSEQAELKLTTQPELAATVH